MIASIQTIRTERFLFLFAVEEKKSQLITHHTHNIYGTGSVPPRDPQKVFSLFSLWRWGCSVDWDQTDGRDGVFERQTGV